MASRNGASDVSESDFRLIGLFLVKGQIMLAYIMFETVYHIYRRMAFMKNYSKLPKRFCKSTTMSRSQHSVNMHCWSGISFAVCIIKTIF